MKKWYAVIMAALLMAVLLCGCGATCHYCGRTITDDPVEASGRTYCTYDCYLNEMFT